MTNYLHYKGIEIAYTVHRKKSGAKNVVFLHGFLERKEIWTDYQTVLAQNYNVIAIDLLGHGETGCLGYIHTMNEMANMVFAVLKHEKFRKSFIVGHSMGGYVALAFGELFPDNTSGICLFNSTAKDDSETKKEDRLRAIKVVKKNHELFIKEAIPNLFANKTNPELQEDIQKTVQLALSTPKQGIIAALEGMRVRDNKEIILKFAPYPVHFIIGKLDKIVPYDTLLEQTELNPDSKYYLSEKGGHLCFLEDAENSLKALQNFIK